MVLNFDDSLNSRVRDSFNTTNNSTANTNAIVGITDSGNLDSGNTSADAWFSGNTDSSTDSSQHDSNNSAESTTTADSNNSYSFTSMDNHSVDVGDRTYNLGGGGEGGSGGGSSTVVDQSINEDVHSGGLFGGSFVYSSPTSVIGSGANSIAAGDDVHIHEDVDDSQHIGSVFGDVNLGDTTTVDTNVGSFNQYTDNSQYTDDSTHMNLDDVGNTLSNTVDTSGSFNEDQHNSTTTDVDANVDVVSDSFLSGIADIHF
ncbi:hypothetical protein HII28_08585 [Planctomonas sp. JC2975]|uniref:hypothetical protein n=1 Tax=Planctomonas sp. JC2975 TaxID=2729626 RepID=UPI001473CD5A|nr:hypothetical protein [Planctomonas sp. JC2975]NNC11935.1 hypothetical protein [Planctomonas sp. JC2975]